MNASTTSLAGSSLGKCCKVKVVKPRVTKVKSFEKKTESMNVEANLFQPIKLDDHF